MWIHWRISKSWVVFEKEKLRERKEKKEEKWSCIAMLSSSMNFNGKFWNFWPNFIHLKIFFSSSVVCLYSICFCFLCAPLYTLKEGYEISWLCICAILSSLFLSLLPHTFLSFLHSDHFANIAEEWNQLPTIFNT